MQRTCTRLKRGASSKLMIFVFGLLQLSNMAGGADRDRTDDLKLAKLALSQLSYGPWSLGLMIGVSEKRRLVGPGRVERPTSRLSGVRSNHLSYEPETLHTQP